MSKLTASGIRKSNKATVAIAFVMFAFICAFIASPSLYAIAPATTTLSVAPGTSVNAGKVLTLTASVSYSGGPVTAGMVMFCDLNVGCSGPNLIGTARVTSNGTATVKVLLGTGTYNIQAIYSATQSVPASQSSSQVITVTGAASYKAGLALSATGTPGQYTLSTVISAFGNAAPTGTVSFVDTSNGNAVLHSMAFSSAKPKMSFVVPSNAQPVAGRGSYATTVGDFNNDGLADLAIVNTGDSTVSVALGKGNGAFSASTTYATGIAPVAIGIGDFNGDGFQDLAVANAGGSSVSILLGNGKGTFHNQVSYALGASPSSVAVSDVNLDGIPDIVVADTNTNSVSVLNGNGDGTFQSAVSYPTGSSPMQIAVADMNNDGWPDVLTANSLDNTVSVLLGNGDGTFASPLAYAAGFEPHAISVGDLNGDGNLDAVVANYGDNTVSVMLGNGDGTFQPKSTVRVGSSPYQTVMADFNHDGYLDVAVANAMGNSVTVLSGSGNGQFQTPVSYKVGNMPTGLVAADFNGDGLPDLALTSFSNTAAGPVSLLLGAQLIQASASTVSLIGHGTHNIVAVYSGDTNHGSGTSQPVALEGITLATTTTVKPSLNPARQGTAVRFTAQVTSTSGVPSGSVTFFNDSVKLQTVSLNSAGQAAFSTTALKAGKHSITAVYSGDSRHSASTSVILNENVDGTASAFNKGTKK